MYIYIYIYTYIYTYIYMHICVRTLFHMCPHTNQTNKSNHIYIYIYSPYVYLHTFMLRKQMSGTATRCAAPSRAYGLQCTTQTWNTRLICARSKLESLLFVAPFTSPAWTRFWASPSRLSRGGAWPRAADLSRRGKLLLRLGCLVTAWLFCLSTALYVDAAAGLSSRGLAVLFSRYPVC